MQRAGAEGADLPGGVHALEGGEVDHADGQVDALLQDLPVNHEHEVADASYKIVEKYDTKEQYGFALAKGKKPELLAAVNEQLKALRTDGTYDTLYKKYFG